MKSAIYLGKERVQVQTVPVPECGEDDILVKNICSSICGTDVTVFKHGPGTGHRITIGGELGHETVSKVVGVGKNIQDVKPGDRIYPYPLYAKNDTSRAGTLGGFSEYMLLPKAKLNHSYYLVHGSISDKVASLIEPFTVGSHAAKQPRPLPGENAVVFGCGTIGIAAAIMLKYLGVNNVLVCDRSMLRLKIAQGLGFVTCNTASADFMEIAETLWGKAKSIHGKTANIDIWIDTAGADSILNDFMRRGKVGARFVIVAVNNTKRNLNLLDLTYSSQSIIGSGGYRPEDVSDVMDIMRSGRWDIESIITAEYPIEEIASAIEAASDPEHNFNVIIRF